MNLLQTHDLLLQQKIAEMPKGTESGLADIFGDDWDSIGSPGQRRLFGREFKAAVKDNHFPSVAWVRIENSGRHDVYLKLSK